jgi:hypothetical protein
MMDMIEKERSCNSQETKIPKTSVTKRAKITTVKVRSSIDIGIPFKDYKIRKN